MTPISSTYRLQLTGAGFTFDDARGIVDYLDRLGISHLYVSPVLTATSGSTHGYDVTDPTSVSAELGGYDGLALLAAELRNRGMGLVIDIVPNHVGVADPRQNRWWWDVLCNGRNSEFADYFDIDWSPDNGSDGRIALPLLGSPDDLGVLEIDRSADEPMLAYYDKRFPVAPGTDDGDATEIHDRQIYRLVDWRAGVSTYRRFFAVSDLAAVRQEDAHVFEATHRQVRRWAEEDLIDGIRVDHIDGLADPAAYLARLREILGPDRALFAEKILTDHEPLDASLPIDGTTGYDALSALGGLFVDCAGATKLTELSRTLTGWAGDAAWLHETEGALKRYAAQTILAPEVRRLVAAVRRDAVTDCNIAELFTATVELVALIPVYRTDYAPLAKLLGDLIGRMERANPERGRALAVLTSALTANGEATVRFQQLCGAVTAKSVEDNLFYRTARLVSLQEVGSNPGRFGWSVNEFHLANHARAQRWPATMTTLSTHDTKRGEDVRARISVLSQVPGRWAEQVHEWERIAPSPDGLTGLFLWQNMFGVWPADGTPASDVPELRPRLHAYAEKAVREGGVHTTWQEPNAAFESAVHRWIDDVVDGPAGTAIGDFARELAPHAWSDSLGQKLLQLCGPGIPDVYQGTELWEDSLVDPDNRRPVEFGARLALLEAQAGTPPLDATGSAKMWVVAHALWLRRDRSECFVGGDYRPLYGTGLQGDRLVAFARGPEDGAAEVVAVCARLTAQRDEAAWAETTLALPDGTWTDRLTGTQHVGRVGAPALLARLPVALLVRD